MSEQSYIELTLPNISYDEMEKSSQRKVAGVSKFMYPLVQALAVKHPEWTFVGTSANRLGQETIEITQFKVLEKREQLGSLRTEWFGRSYAYGIHNDRIGQELQRGYAKKTTKVDKAIKLVEKHFYTKNLVERYTESKQVADQVVGRFAQRKNQEMQSRWRALDRAIKEYITLNFDSFKAILTNNEEVKIANEMPDSMKEAMYVEDVYKAFRTNSTYNVVLMGMDYIVGEGDEITVLPSDKVPELIRRRLGLLKLVQDGFVIEGTGARVNENTYVILKGE
jgi:hypothetical protein